MNRSLFLVVACLSSVGLLADEHFHSIMLKGYPRTSVGCAATAQSIAAIFKQATGSSMVTGHCAFQKWASFDLEIRYSTDKPDSHIASPDWPIYNSYAQCSANLAAEEQSFREATGLAPFLKYCAEQGEVGHTGGNISLYGAAFHAIGTPRAFLRTLSFDLRGSAFLGGDSTVNEIVQKSKEAGIPAVAAAVLSHPHAWSSTLWIRFLIPAGQFDFPLQWSYLLKHDIQSLYAPVRAPGSAIDTINPFRFDSSVQCEEQRQRAQTFMNPVFTGSATWFCMWAANDFEANLYHLRIKPGEEGFRRIVPGDDGEPIANVYPSVAQCEADKGRVLAYYRAKLTEPVPGALCSYPVRLRPNIPIRMFVYVTLE